MEKWTVVVRNLFDRFNDKQRPRCYRNFPSRFSPFVNRRSSLDGVQLIAIISIRSTRVFLNEKFGANEY